MRAANRRLAKLEKKAGATTDRVTVICREIFKPSVNGPVWVETKVRQIGKAAK